MTSPIVIPSAKPAPILAAVSIVVAVTGLGMAARSLFHLSVVSLPDVVALYMLAIAATAVRYGRASSLVASALAVAAYDFVFVPPYWTLAVDDARHILTFATMFGVGVFISGLTARIRERETEARAATLKASTEQIRSSLLSAVSHDLRTPLGAITGAATTLRDGTAELSTSQRAELLDAICDESERLERLVANLLEMTRLAATDVEIRAEWVPLEELVTSALARLETRIGARDVVVDLASDLPLLHADPVLLEQLLLNLLDNALKYSSEGSPLEVRALLEQERVQIHVSDRGRGLGGLDPEGLFEKFVRGSNPGIRGSGLGLAICKAIAVVHGGGIRAGNREEGGAEFEVWLPASRIAPQLDLQAPLEALQ